MDILILVVLLGIVGFIVTRSYTIYPSSFGDRSPPNHVPRSRQNARIVKPSLSGRNTGRLVQLVGNRFNQLVSLLGGPSLSSHSIEITIRRRQSIRSQALSSM